MFLHGLKAFDVMACYDNPVQCEQMKSTPENDNLHETQFETSKYEILSKPKLTNQKIKQLNLIRMIFAYPTCADHKQLDFPALLSIERATSKP